MNLNRNSKYYVVFAGFFCFIIFTVYFYHFHGEISPDQAIWGAFGDFIGGTLNPILSFIALILILNSIRIQSEELQETRKELKETKEIHRENLRVIEYQKRDITLANLIQSLRSSFEAEVYTFKSSLINCENVSMLQLAADIHACRGSDLIQNDKDVHATYDQFLMYMANSRVFSGLQVIKHYIESSQFTDLDEYTYRILVHNTLSKEFWRISSWAVGEQYFGVNNTFNEPLSFFVDKYGCCPANTGTA